MRAGMSPGGRKTGSLGSIRGPPGWSNASPEVRSDVLDKAGSLIMSRAKELGTLLSREEGKTLPEGTGEVMRAARICK